MESNDEERESEARQKVADWRRQKQDAQNASSTSGSVAEGEQGDLSGTASGEPDDCGPDYVDLIHQRMRELDHPEPGSDSAG